MPMDKTAMEAALNQWRATRSPEILGELLKAQRDRAYAIALRLRGSSADAEDVVQQAFLKMLSRTDGFDNAEAFETSVYRAVLQCAGDAFRQQHRRAARELKAACSGTGEEPVSQTAEIQIERNDTLAALNRALAKLPEDERAPVVLHYYQGLSAVAAARVLEVPRETVRARLQRALNHLRQALKADGHNPATPALLALMWNGGAETAPQTLCRTLDKLLPGRSCSEIPAIQRPAPPSPTPAPSVQTHVVLAAAVAGALLLGGIGLHLAGNAFGSKEKAHESRPVVTGRSLSEEPAGTKSASVGATEHGPAAIPERKEEDVKKLGAILLAGGMLLPTALSAGEPNADAAKACDAIAARREAKVQAQAAAAKDAPQRKKEAWGSPQGGSLKPGAAAPGQDR
jgi:RNA polymerase sigma-70 factor, ECF subfamily